MQWKQMDWPSLVDSLNLLGVSVVSVTLAIDGHGIIRAIDPQKEAHWNNEVEDLVVWVNPPEGWQVDTRYLTVPRPKETVSQETRRVEFELRCPETTAPGRATIPTYALYYVCEDVDGTCLYQRQDVTLDVQVRR